VQEPASCRTPGVCGVVRGTAVGGVGWGNGAVRTSEECGTAAGSIVLLRDGRLRDGFFVVSGEERHFMDLELG
jgi:hypothetical protein